MSLQLHAHTDSVYVGHERHWTAMMTGVPKETQFGPPFIEFHVVSFNYFSLPPYPNEDYRFDIMEYGDMLGAVGRHLGISGAVVDKNSLLSFRVRISRGTL